MPTPPRTHKESVCANLKGMQGGEETLPNAKHIQPFEGTINPCSDDHLKVSFVRRFILLAIQCESQR